MRPGTAKPQWHPEYPYVCFVPEGVDMDTGWYYVDHMDGLNGPYETAEAAKESLDHFTRHYL